MSKFSKLFPIPHAFKSFRNNSEKVVILIILIWSALSGIRTRDTNNQAGAGLHLTPHI